MATSRKSKKQQKKILTGIIILIIVILIAVFALHPGDSNTTNPEPTSTATPTVTASIPPTSSATATPTASPTPTKTPTAVSDSSPFTVHMIDVGQGDAILLAKDGKYALIDAGETMSPSTREARDKLFAYLNKLGVKKLEFLLVTHQDYDHIGSAPDVMKKYSVGQFYDNGVTHTSATYEKMMTTVLEEDIPYTVIRAGDTIKSPWTGVKFTVLSPPQDLLGKDINKNSIVMKVTYGDTSFLLTGDAESATEESILKTGANINADILKAGHHGSRSSSTDAFLRAVSPDVILISCGEDNEYGHPHLEVMKRYAKIADVNHIFRTDIDGDIVVTTDGTSYSVETSNKPRDLSQILVSGNGEAVSA